MAELTPGDRRDLIVKYVDKAKINWAHIGIACLMKEGYVDRVLTTNFDLLVMRACALLGEFPAVYDFATSQLLTPAYIPDKAVFHLHGQRTGFVLMSTDDECKKQSERLGPLFQDAGGGRVWIVVGYSGENDPVFDHLAGVNRFDYGLYWVGYQDQEPAPHVSEKLLTEGKDAFFVKGFDADSFFVTLTQRLDIFPPSLVQRPFTHLDRVFQMLSPFNLPGEVEDVTRTPREWIRRAITDFEEGGRLIADAGQMLMARDYGGVVALRPQYEKHSSKRLGELISWAYVMQGNSLASQAETKTGEEADRLLAQAGEKFAAALEIKPDKHQALYNWGNALFAQAKTKSGEETDRLFAEAGERYAAALAIKPDMHEALNNWGNTLAAQAKTKGGEEADRLFAQAGEKYAAAVAIKPDKHEALNNWGNTLADQARTKTGGEAERLFAQAGEKYAAALIIKPDKHGTLYHWGNALWAQAKTKSGEEADRLFAEAGEKYGAALTIKSDKHEAFYNWGNALADQAEPKTGDEADRLFAQAGEKYAAALAIKPDIPEALYGWGSVLLAQAMTKTGDEADRLFAQAAEKYGAALAIKPDMHEALYNWGGALLAQAKTKTGDEAESLFAQAGEKYAAALAIKPDMDEALNNWGYALLAQAKTKMREEADRLLAQGAEKFGRVEEISPGGSAFNLACVAALIGDEDGCLKWLEKSNEARTLPDREHLLTDEDLASVRECQWFKNFLKDAYPEQG
jgi:Tfp pilus assembly protein PilF